MVEGFFGNVLLPKVWKPFAPNWGPIGGPVGPTRPPGPPNCNPPCIWGPRGVQNATPPCNVGPRGPGRGRGVAANAPRRIRTTERRGNHAVRFRALRGRVPGLPPPQTHAGRFRGLHGGVLEALGGGPGGPGRGPGGPDNAPHDFAVGVPTQRATAKSCGAFSGPPGGVLEAPGGGPGGPGRGPGGPGRRSWRGRKRTT